MKKYPRLGQIETVRPQGLCALCNTSLLGGKKPEKQVHIQYNWFRGDDEIYKMHKQCLKTVGKWLIDCLTI